MSWMPAPIKNSWLPLQGASFTSALLRSLGCATHYHFTLSLVRPNSQRLFWPGRLDAGSGAQRGSSMVEKGSDGFYHPISEEEVVELIALARSEALKLRVRGAGHSEPGAVAEAASMVLLLDRMSGVSFDDAS